MSFLDALLHHDGSSEAHGSRWRDATHLGVQSFGRAVDGADALVQNAMSDARAHGAEYGHLSEKNLGTTHTAMKYLNVTASLADTAVESDGTFFKNLFKSADTVPDLLMPMLHGETRQPAAHF